ncbi:MAG: hypothetical protein KF789_00250 [Bdellovibrionaceae bacterium]|nr:hypothetical protein [Pseudobdellovibrionaceae bacterium]
MAFSEDFQKRFEREFDLLLEQDLSGQACETRQQTLSSLILSWTLINYASITPKEADSVEQLVSRLSSRTIPTCRP